MPNQMSLDGGRKSKYLELKGRNHTETVRTCKLHTERHLRPGSQTCNLLAELTEMVDWLRRRRGLCHRARFNRGNFGILYVEVLTVSPTLHYLYLHNNSSWRTCSDSLSPRQSSSEVVAHRKDGEKKSSSAVDFRGRNRRFGGFLGDDAANCVSKLLFQPNWFHSGPLSGRQPIAGQIPKRLSEPVFPSMLPTRFI